MIKTWFLLGCLCVSCIVAMSFWPERADELPNMPKTVDFSYHIQPILSKNCYTCHGNDPSSRKAELRLDIEDHAKATLESGHRAIVNKSLRRSELINRILSDDPDIQMPPPESKKKLTKREIALLQKWIKQGAKWNDHWAFIKPKIAEDNDSNIPNSIDHYILEGHKSKELEQSVEAKKHELIRRASFILTGLPPSGKDQSQFINDNGADAYEKMIDRYLASSHYGEKWARHWMDLVRYGESMGHEGDFNISNAYEYRDYVIRAFNQDVSYDLFVKEHLAGDMLDNPRIHPTEGFNESQIGTAYFFLGEGKHAPVDIKLEESEKIDNMIDVTSKTFSALTVACSKCHDHKFDPIPTTDYYSMYGMIESSRLIPKAARKLDNAEELITEIKDIKSDLKAELLEYIRKQKIDDKINESSDRIVTTDLSKDSMAVVLADFRANDWDGWYTDGIAFGDGPLKNNIDILNPKKEFKSSIEYEEQKLHSHLEKRKTSTVSKGTESRKIEFSLLSGFASSRAVAKGLQGVLHGPNFKNDFDTIAIRARGKNGTLRIVVDNFQVFQGPLWDLCEIVVNENEWKTYKLSAKLAKGNKAYLEFFPGRFKHHVYGIQPDDFIDIQWAVGYSGNDPIGNKSLYVNEDILIKESVSEFEGVINNKGPLNHLEHIGIINKYLEHEKIELDPIKIDRLFDLQETLYDPSHFIGMAEGDAVLSSVFNRGSIKDRSAEKVPHQFLSSVQLSVEFPQHGSGRLAWAEALIHKDNPLTARVMINRIWHHLFGRGIVETVDNFGIQGQIPSHPELLDYLALKFIEKGWSVKTMIKEIMMSQTFKMSTKQNLRNSEIDPENIFLHTYPVRRLEAEGIRDGILAVSGCLDTQMYGHSVPVYLSNFMTGRGRPHVSGPIDSYGRRSIYQSIRRNFISEMMITFDMPIPFTSFGKRNVTNVPAQSLTLLNDVFIHEQAYYWAEDLIRTTKTESERIYKIYATAYSRKPTQIEIDQALQFIKSMAAKDGQNLKSELNKVDLWTAFCHSIFNTKEFIHLI